MKRLVLWTLGIACGIFGVLILSERYYPQEILFNEEVCPAFGEKNAPIELVLFEDFQCAHCQTFIKEVFPHLHREYVKTHLVRFVFIPLATFPGSDLMANAALCIYRHAPQKFLEFVHRMIDYFRLEEVSEEEVHLFTQRWAKEEGELLGCIENNEFYGAIQDNMMLARRLMKTVIRTPSLYLNGYLIPVGTLEETRGHIERALEEIKEAI